jgi:long-chain acyl-CoA synthetase
MRYNNLSEMFFNNVDRLPDRTAYMYKDEGSYKSINFSQAADWVKKIAGGLVANGIGRGDKVALLSENRFEWAFCDFAILTLGAITVPIYPSLLPNQVEYILKDSESKILVCSTKDQFEKVEKSCDTCEHLKSIIVMDKDFNNDKCLSLEQLMQNGKEELENRPDYLSEQIKMTKSDDLATIIYTSGTTGEPKGAMLSHGNFLANVEGSLEYLHVGEDDVFLSFLPLCHVFERMAGHFLASYSAATIAYAESIDTVSDNMAEVRPTIMTSVPRLYEKIYARVLENVETGSAVKRKIFYWAHGVGRDYVNHIMNKKPIGKSLQTKRNIAYKLVFQKLAERVGGKLRFFVSGGAPLAKEIGEFFGAAGLMIFEGYGLTETSPVIAVNKEDQFKFGSVGLPLKNIEIKIAEDGEILTRGPHIMLGYYNKENETREAIDEDGWFHTGDIGFIDDEGFLAITDRKKNIIITSGGKNVTPQPIENQMVTCKYIEQAMVIGDGRKFCTAVIVPAFEVLEKWAKENNVSYTGRKELSQLTEVKEMVQKDVESVNSNLASFEAIKDFILTGDVFSIETGELTPSLKVKRKVVLNKFKDSIEAMYQV